MTAKCNTAVTHVIIKFMPESAVLSHLHYRTTAHCSALKLEAADQNIMLHLGSETLL